MFKTEIKEVLRMGRISKSLEDKGITIKAVKKSEYFNMTFVAGRLNNGKVRIYWRTEIKGNTFAIKDIIKAAGFKWDANEKCWYSNNNNGYAELGAKILKELA